MNFNAEQTFFSPPIEKILGFFFLYWWFARLIFEYETTFYSLTKLIMTPYILSSLHMAGIYLQCLFSIYCEISTLPHWYRDSVQFWYKTHHKKLLLILTSWFWNLYRNEKSRILRIIFKKTYTTNKKLVWYWYKDK